MSWFVWWICNICNKSSTTRTITIWLFVLFGFVKAHNFWSSFTANTITSVPFKNYLLVSKRGNWKSNIYRWYFLFKTPFIDVYSGFSIAIFDYRRVYSPLNCWTSSPWPQGSRCNSSLHPSASANDFRRRRPLRLRENSRRSARRKTKCSKNWGNIWPTDRMGNDGKMGKLVARTLVVAILFVWALTNRESLFGGSWGMVQRMSERKWEERMVQRMSERMINDVKWTNTLFRRSHCVLHCCDALVSPL